jgi:hypothetical protein
MSDLFSFDLKLEFKNINSKGNTKIVIGDNVFISCEDQTCFKHELVINHIDFIKVLDFYQKSIYAMKKLKQDCDEQSGGNNG